jgi:hypothetical protein
MKSLLFALGFLLTATTAPATASLRPGDLSLDVVVDSRPEAATPDAEVARGVIFKLSKTTIQPVKGQIVLRYPSTTGVYSGLKRVYPFNFSKGKSMIVGTVIRLPRGTPSGQHVFPVEVLVGKQKYLYMDLIVTKGMAWRYIAPFPGGPEASHDKAFPPETEINFKASYTGANNEKLSWKLFPSSAISANGLCEFHQFLGMIPEVTAYATTDVYAPRTTKARVLVGSDDSIKIWQNGKLIHSKLIHRGCTPGEDRIETTLVKGKNTFLLKICQGDGGWSYHFAIDDGTGKPVKGLKYDVVVGRGFPTDDKLRLVGVKRTAAGINWQSDVPVASTISVIPAEPGRALPVWGDTPKSKMVKPAADGTLLVFKEDRLTTNHKFTVTGLEAGTRYLLTVSPAIGGKPSEPISFYTAPPPGQTMHLRLKVANVIFTNVTPKVDADKPGAKDPVPQEEIDRVKRECQMAQMFYWINSGMRLLLDNDFYITDRFYEVPDDSAYGVGYGEGDEAALKELVEAGGKKLSDYDGRNFITVEKRWDANGKKWSYPHSGGGTIGPEGDPGYGKSAWKGGGQNSWLYTHEFGHQIDALYAWSMGPEYLFNHFQPWDDTAHRHGEHYDGNAWILREWAGYYTRQHQGWPMLAPTLWFRYFINRWGLVEFADDKDEDGIPDNAPDVPLDEVRWKSDPAKMDTDGDGLSDLGEAMACEWVDYGLGEIWAGPVQKHRCDPTNPDTDGDGVLDGADPYPLYAVKPTLAQRTPRFDGLVSGGEYADFARLEDSAWTGDFYIAWDKSNLYVAGESPAVPEEIKIYLDLNDNGWYFGHDNYHMLIRPAGLSPGKEWHASADMCFEAAFHNCGVPGKWPFYDAEGLKDGEIKFAQSKESGYSFEVAVPKNTKNGLELKPGERIGILIAVGPQGGAGRPGQFGQLTIFEPHTLFALELAK